MSIYAIQQYHKELEKIIHYGGSKKETAIRNAFYYLLNVSLPPSTYCFAAKSLITLQTKKYAKRYGRSGADV